ncbi:hypothetical protein [Longitalea luteola]|uniref:hypothetical protein n=1 Tax=Longitalea luteola TaxID=2812563 RepID=UPI001A9716BD|nr:hypothetical protein [Longitalea luteola]
MRGTWIILLIMVVAGVGMYFWFNRKPKAANHDTIVFKNTPDSIIKKLKVYVADDPKEVMYLDSIWMQADSTPLRQVLNGVEQDTMSKQYSNITLFITYGQHSFYDLELKKPDPKMAYTLNFEIEPMSDSDTLIIDGLITPQQGDAIHFASPMMELYSKFVVTYNHKLPQPPPDSTAIRGHDPNKTITILKN